MNPYEINTAEQNNQADMTNAVETGAFLSSQTMLFPLQVIQYLFLTTFVSAGIITAVFPDDKRVIIAGGIALAVFISLSLINKQIQQSSMKYDIAKKAGLYLVNNNNNSAQNSIILARGKALQYCQEMIEDYKKTRNQARNLYYILQMSTIVFSGVTPILVLVDKLEAGQAWLKWLPVICPAIASIVASVVTSFPFQKNSIAANTAVELLEAEQEKFILGVTPSYRCYDVLDQGEQQQKAQQAIENFIVNVNNIHLNQLTQIDDKQQKDEKTQSSESEKS